MATLISVVQVFLFILILRMPRKVVLGFRYFAYYHTTTGIEISCST